MHRLALTAVALVPLLAHAEPTPLQRATAARLTAEKSAACVAAQPFYWELGNATQPLAGGKAGDNAPDRGTEMAIASASKWLYGAFVATRESRGWVAPKPGAVSVDPTGAGDSFNGAYLSARAQGASPLEAAAAAHALAAQVIAHRGALVPHEMLER